MQCEGFSLPWLLLLRSTGYRHGLQQLWHISLVAPWHVGCSRTRSGTCFCCIRKWIPNHGPPGKSWKGTFLTLLGRVLQVTCVCFLLWGRMWAERERGSSPLGDALCKKVRAKEALEDDRFFKCPVVVLYCPADLKSGLKPRA